MIFLQDLPFELWELGMIDKVGIRLKVNEINHINDVIEGLLNVNERSYELATLREENLFNYGKSGEIIANTLIEIAEE